MYLRALSIHQEGPLNGRGKKHNVKTKQKANNNHVTGIYESILYIISIFHDITLLKCLPCCTVVSRAVDKEQC